MLFNSFTFVIFLAIVLTLVWSSPHRVQNWILVVASCFFYGWWDWRFLGLLFFTSGVDFIAAQRIEDAPTLRRKKAFLGCSLGANLGVLGFFKYCNFFEQTLAHALHPFGIVMPERLLNVVLPVGISFYTFQAMSYTIDVYRGRMEACRNLKDFLVYITFFPQLVAGPIERARELLPQLRRPRSLTRTDVAEGFYLVIWGYAKKTVVADNLGLKVDRIFAQGSLTTADVLIGTIGFAFQIYADFSGYTDIARGVARWLGVRLTLNFDHPYFASNPQDFWRRWHISLSTWLREYLYIPLGGNRLGEPRTYGNLMATMLLGGLWHGAAWNFVLWGGYQGALLSAHRWYAERRPARLPNHGSALWRVAGTTAMFTFVLYGWLLFRTRGSAQLIAANSALAHWHMTPDFASRLAHMLPYIGLLLAVDTGTYCSGDAFFFARCTPVVTAIFYLFLVYLIAILGVTGGEQFIYFTF
jgi:alginate O-acetyltransferase complex protein AlgI